MNEIEQRIRASKSESFRRINAVHLVGGLRADKSKQNERRALEQEAPAPKASGVKVAPRNGLFVRVSIIRCGPRPLDGDNLTAAYKQLRDSIASSLSLDDADSWIDWEYSQVRTRGRRGTIVKLEML